MSKLFWSTVLQWSRFGLNATVFLLAARVLSLQQFGTFATAFALIKLAQGLHKSGISETVIIKTPSSIRLYALFNLSVIFGLTFSALYLFIATMFDFSNTLALLGIIPTALGLSAVSDGLLRKNLNIRALALRTTAAQSIAAIAALTALYNGAGIAALVLFAVLNTSLSSVISILLAGWYPSVLPVKKHMRLTLKTVLQIAGRDFLNSGILPIVQIAVGTFIGLPAAGAFQVATRLLSMLDALTLAPLRYIALPRLSALKSAHTFDIEIAQSLRLSAILACWVWFGLASSTTQVLGFIVSEGHASAVTPILQALIPLGISAAITMTFTQALMAKGQTQLVLSRATWTCALSLMLTLPMLQTSPTQVAIALSAANILVLIWFLRKAILTLTIPAETLLTIVPPAAAGALMFVIIYVLSLPLLGGIILGTALYSFTLSAFYIRLQKRVPA